jgi:hydroxypyruvate isomerase
MFQFCFNSTTLRNLDVFEALSQIQAHGYAGVELTLNDSHLHPLHSPPERVAAIGEYCSRYGIPLVCLAAGGEKLASDLSYEPSLITLDADGRRFRIDLLKKALRMAQQLKIPVLNFNSGRLQQGVAPERAWEDLRQGVNELLGECGETELVLEPEPGFFIGTTRDAIRLIREIDDPRFRLNMDIGHVQCSEDDCYEAIEAAMPYTRHMHIEDIKGRVHHHEIPGEGEIDFDRVFASIKKAQYNHYVSVELHHHDQQWRRALQESLDYLRRYSEAVA